MYFWLLLLHLLGAMVWTGGHLILALGILPGVLRRRDLDPLLAFEERYERVGLPAMALQVATGLALTWRYYPGFRGLLAIDEPLVRAVLLKLVLLAATLGLALDARFRLIPRLTPDTLNALAWHILAVTGLSIAFVYVGASFRFGGIP